VPDSPALHAWLLAVLGTQPSSTRLLLLFLVPHALASVLLAVGATLVFPPRYRIPTGWLLAAIFGFVFFLPVIGPVVVGLGALLNLYFPSLFHQYVFGRTPKPTYQLPRDRGQAGEGGLRGGDARARLRDRATPVARRMQALLTVGDAPTRVTGALLRELLADPVEDMRLLAYGMMEKREQLVSGQLLRQRELLAQARSEAEVRVAARRVAELYWELIYQDLVQGDMAAYALEQARVHAERALAHDHSDGPLWLLLARIKIRQELLDEAEEALRNALAGGVADSAVLPYLAELHFLHRRFDKVRDVLRQMAPAGGVLDPLRRYWGRTLPGAPVA